MQNVLPVSGQNSHLFVVVTTGRIMLYFSFADYEQNISFSEHFQQPLPSDFDVSILDGILSDILVTWGADIGLDLRSDSTGVIHAIYYKSLKIGGTSLAISEGYYQEGYHSSVLACIPSRISEDERLDYAKKYMRVYRPSDLIWVSLDWDKISVYSISRIGGANSQEVDLKEFTIEHSMTYRDMAAQLQNVIGIHIEKDNVRNILANVLHKQIMISNSSEVWDVIRSYITTSLIKIKDPVLKEFGMKTSDAHLMITGDICSVLSPETLFLAVIDGLQVRGRFRVIVDQEQKSIVLGESLRTKTFALPVSDLFLQRYLYISCESDIRARDGGLAFKGIIEDVTSNNTSHEKEIAGLTGYFHTYNIGGVGRILIDPVKSSFFPNLYREGKNLIVSCDSNDSRIIIDCRKIPVVYGPDETSNLQRIREWINGLKLSD